jgi:arylsulfatase A-like enzyme
VFSSDNGFHTGQRRMLPGKQTAYDTDIRVPLIVAGPGVPAGRTVDTVTSSIDLAPTFEQIAGAHSPFAHDGSSMLDQWHGRPASSGWPPGVLVEHRFTTLPGDPDRQGTRTGNSPDYEAVRTADYLYVEYATGDREYYDLRTDPDELDNIADELPPRRLAQLHLYLRGLATCRGAGCRRAGAG